MSYLQFLQLLSQFAGKLPQVLAAIKAFGEWYNTYILPLIPASEQTPRVFGAAVIDSTSLQLSAEEIELENALCQPLPEMCSAHPDMPKEFGAIGDGKILSLIRQAYQYVLAHPEIVPILISLFGKA